MKTDISPLNNMQKTFCGLEAFINLFSYNVIDGVIFRLRTVSPY